MTAPTFNATNFDPAGDSFEPGATVPLHSSVIGATASDTATDVIIVQSVYLGDTLIGAQQAYYNQNVAGAGGTPTDVQRGFALPADAEPGPYSFFTTVENSDWTACGNTANFNASGSGGAHFTVAAATVAPVLLRPAVPGTDPLVTGFVPDDGTVFQTVFRDDFNGPSLDRNAWWTRYHDYGGTLDHYGDECQRYDDNHQIVDGCLRFTAIPQQPITEAHTPSPPPDNYTYPIMSSQMVRSRMTFKFGYVEWRVRCPKGLGMFPALWLLKDAFIEGQWPNEIDVLESAYNGVTETGNMIHTCNIHNDYVADPCWYYEDEYLDTEYGGVWKPWDYVGSGDPNGFINDDFHIYSLYWVDDQPNGQPGMITCYIDGTPIGSREFRNFNQDGSDSGPMSVIMNLASGGGWACYNFTTPMDQTGQVMDIDYVKVLQDVDNIQTDVSAV